MEKEERGIKRNCMNPSLTDGGLMRMRSEDEDEDEVSISSVGERKRGRVERQEDRERRGTSDQTGRRARPRL